MSQTTPNYKAVLIRIIRELRNSLRNASFSQGEAQVKEIEKVIDHIEKIEFYFDEYVKSLGSTDFTDRRFTATIEIINKFYSKLSELKNTITNGRLFLALNRTLPETESALSSAMTALLLVSKGAPVPTIAPLVPQAQNIPTSIPSTLQITNPVAGQVYGYLTRKRQADIDTIARELGLGTDAVLNAVNYLISNNYVRTELSPENKVIAKIIREEREEV